MIKALIFDCFGVFYPDPVFAYMRDPATPRDKSEALHALDEQAARGALTKAEFIKNAAPLVGISETEAEQRFFHSLERNEQLIEYTQALRSQYKIALLSNIGGDMMDGFFSPEDQKRLFDIVILSGNVQMAKPDRAIFELTCQRLGVELHEAVMIDDMESTCNIVKGFGMQSVCYKDFDAFKAELANLLA